MQPPPRSLSSQYVSPEQVCLQQIRFPRTAPQHPYFLRTSNLPRFALPLCRVSATHPPCAVRALVHPFFFLFHQGQNQSANDHLETRKNALSRHDTLLDTLKSQKARLLLAQHSFAITSVLGEELCELYKRLALLLGKIVNVAVSKPMDSVDQNDFR